MYTHSKMLFMGLIYFRYIRILKFPDILARDLPRRNSSSGWWSKKLRRSTSPRPIRGILFEESFHDAFLNREQL